MVAALDLGSSAERRVGSSPSVRTNKKITALGGRWSQKAVFLMALMCPEKQVKIIKNCPAGDFRFGNL